MTAELMLRAQAGDLDAFGQLYAEHREHLLAVARKRLPAEAEDIVQDVFVRALTNLDGWADQGKSPRAWLTVITVNMCFDRARSPRLRKTTLFSFDYEHAELDRPDTAGDEPEQSAVRREEAAEATGRVGTALAALSPEQREAIVLRYLHEQRNDAVAEQMGRHVNAVRSLIYRARQEMKRVLADA